jgi:septal ring-binding cell division protein DamX
MEITEMKIVVKDTELNTLLHQIMGRLDKIEHLLQEKQSDNDPNQLPLPLERTEPKTRKKKTEKKVEEPVKEEPVKEEPVKEEPVKEEPVKEEPVKEETKSYTESEIRACLAGLIKTGKQPQVKALLAEFEVNKLSEIPSERYSEVMEKAAKI